MPPTNTRRRRDAAGIVLGLAMVTTGLIAGVYYSYACSVILGLARTDDHTFIGAMQQINDAIQNPVFFASFFGALVLTGWPSSRNGAVVERMSCVGWRCLPVETE